MARGLALAEVGSMVLEVGSMARGLALGTAGNKLAEGEVVHEQAHAEVEVVGQHRDCRAKVQDKVLDIAGDRAGRPAAGIQAQGSAEDKAQGTAGGTVGILADGTRAQGLVQQKALRIRLRVLLGVRLVYWLMVL